MVEKKVTKTEFSSKKTKKNDLTSSSKKNLGSWKKIISKKTEKEDSGLPVWLVILFLFSIAFFLFALYKVFIYWKWYDFVSDTQNQTIQNQDEDTIYTIDLESAELIQQGDADEEPVDFVESENEGNNPLIDESLTPDDITLSNEERLGNDVLTIQSFYSYLMNNQTSEMNAIVDTPLRNSAVWNTHWSQKNIKIFTKHLEDTVILQNIYLIPNSVDEKKGTRKYSYTLDYTIDTNESFSEEWEITLISRNDKILISEIMCKTTWCSHSPFFWPQNYGLK